MNTPIIIGGLSSSAREPHKRNFGAIITNLGKRAKRIARFDTYTSPAGADERERGLAAVQLPMDPSAVALLGMPPGTNPVQAGWQQAVPPRREM
ncbi:hypothetical protein B4Q13_18950 [Lacticaseibacillus rhamnosus]